MNRMKLTAVALLLIATSVGGAQQLGAPTTEATILVARRQPQHGTDAREDYLGTHAILLRSPLLIEQAVAAHKLAALKSLTGRDAVGAIIQGLSVRRDAEAPVLVLTFKGADTKDATAILNALIASFREFLETTYRTGNEEILQLISRARDGLLRELGELAFQYSQFRAEAPTVLTGRSTIADRITAVEAKRTALLVRHVEVNARARTLREALASGRDKAAALLRIWSSGDDVVRKFDSAEAYLAALGSEAEQSQAIEDGLNQLLERLQREAGALTAFEIRDEVFRADRDRKQKLFDTIVKRMSDIQLARDTAGYHVQVVAPPHAVVAQDRGAAVGKEAALNADFVGKIVFVQTAKDAATLEEARVTQLGERPFLVGRVVRENFLTKALFVGTTSYVPVSDIVRIVVCDNLEQLKNSVSAR
jgi:hypothetical protein